ncbi:hypothetical protein V1291_003167 [Nitrobacteraceae bacterium AZCC 1564]
MKHATAITRSIRPLHGRVVAFAVLAASLPAISVGAQETPDTENGRFALSPVPEGFLRLDTRTGAISTCSSVKGNWVCRAVPDERAALDTEIGRLQADNKKLKEQLAQRDTVTGKTDAPLGKEDRKDLDSKSAQGPSDKKAERPLSAEHEKLLALIDRVWDQLIDMAVRLQKKLSEKI